MRTAEGVGFHCLSMKTRGAGWASDSCHPFSAALYFSAFSFLCGRLSLPLCSPTLSCSVSPHFTLGGGVGTILCDIFKDLMSPPFFLGRRLQELFMFLQKHYYFDKMSGHSGSVTVEKTSSQNKTLGSSTSWFLRT